MDKKVRMFPKFFVFVILLIVLTFSSALDYETKAPEFLRIVKKAKTTSVEIQVQRVNAQNVYERCPAHAVQLRLQGEGEQAWHLIAITENPRGTFTIRNLSPGTKYEVRVACVFTRMGSPSTGAFSRPFQFETPFVNPKDVQNGKGSNDSNESDENDEESDHKDPKNGNNSSSTIRGTTLASIFLTFLAFYSLKVV